MYSDRALDSSLLRHVAVKKLKPEGAHEIEARRRLTEEAQITAQLMFCDGPKIGYKYRQAHYSINVNKRIGDEGVPDGGR